MVLSYRQKPFAPFGKEFHNMPPKTCPQCGTSFGRKMKSGKMRTVRDFSNMTFCSKVCASEKAKKDKHELEKSRIYRNRVYNNLNREKINMRNREAYAQKKAAGTLDRVNWFDGKGPVCQCGSEKFSVLNTRKHQGLVRRQRVCAQCSDRVNTVEIPESLYDTFK